MWKQLLIPLFICLYQPGTEVCSPALRGSQRLEAGLRHLNLGSDPVGHLLHCYAFSTSCSRAHFGLLQVCNTHFTECSLYTLQARRLCMCQVPVMLLLVSCTSLLYSPPLVLSSSSGQTVLNVCDNWWPWVCWLVSVLLRHFYIVLMVHCHKFVCSVQFKEELKFSSLKVQI